METPATDLFALPLGVQYEQKNRPACHVRDGRAEDVGAGALSDVELLAAVLGSTDEAQALAERMLTGETLAGMAGWRAVDFRRARGIGEAASLRLLAAFEIGRRVSLATMGTEPLLTRADLIATYMRPFADSLLVEKLWVLCLNRKNRLIRRVELTVGTATSALAHPREVFRAAVQHASAAIVVVHNHPSGDPSPSSADLQITRLLRDAAKTVEISLLDHVILGNAGADPTGRGYYSFSEAGII